MSTRTATATPPRTDTGESPDVRIDPASWAPPGVTFRTVVVGIDGSEGGRAALRWAAGCTTDEIHAIETVSPAAELLESSVQVDSPTFVDRARHDLDAACDELGSGLRARVTPHVIEDGMARGLVDAAHRHHADAIVVGAEGDERRGHLVGANIGGLIHASDLPVVVVPASSDHVPGPSTSMRDRPWIVVGTSRNPIADAALVSWVRDHRCDGPVQLELLHAISSTVLAILPTADDASEVDTAVRRAMDDLLADVTDPRLVGQTNVVYDDPLSALAESSTRADLVVVGSHRSGRVGGFLTGSIAQHLPAMTDCAVALIPVGA